MGEYSNVAVVVLAAGKGTRMKSEMAKVLHKVAGKSMVSHVISSAKKIAPDHVHVVVGHQADRVKEEVSKSFQVHFSLQKQLLGTGDAVKSALPDLDPVVKDVMVLCGDVPLIKEQTLQKLVKGHRKEKAKVTVLAVRVDNPTGYGRMVLDEKQNLLSIVEQADADEDQKKIDIINTGIYCFDRDILTSAIQSLRPDNNQAEYYLTDVVEIASRRHEKVIAVTMDDPRQVIGVNTLEELDRAGHLIDELDR